MALEDLEGLVFVGGVTEKCAQVNVLLAESFQRLLGRIFNLCLSVAHFLFLQQEKERKEEKSNIVF